MASVWKRLQRVNKRAAKFQFTASYHRLDLELSPKWTPNKLSLVWTRRSRRVVTEPKDWEPSLKDPLKGTVIWDVPENHTIAVTLFKDPRTNELEDKDWMFVLEDVSLTGKRRKVGSAAINMRQYASVEASQRPIILQLKTTRPPYVPSTITIHLTLSCVLLREGRATDEDMQSLASLLSVNNTSDIAPLQDLDDDDVSFSDSHSASLKQVLDLTQQMEQMTNSLTSNDLYAITPLSIQSIQSLMSDDSKTPIQSPSMEQYDRIDHYGSDLPISERTPEPITPEAERPIERVTGEVDMKTQFKNLKFTTTHVTKHNLKPLELKSFNAPADVTTNADTIKVPNNKDDKISSDKTPVQDLLEWCKDITKDYPQCKVTNLTTSWRNGIAFCAVIHHFRPDLIDLSTLLPHEAEKNVRLSLEAAAKLGIPPILTTNEVCKRAIPDRLAVMTHLFQLRAHFTGAELHVQQLGSSTVESSYSTIDPGSDLMEEQDTPNVDLLYSADVMAARRRRANNIVNANVDTKRSSLSSQDSVDSQNSQDRPQSPASVKDLKGMFLTSSKSLISNVLSPTKPKIHKQPSSDQFITNNINSDEPAKRPVKLMTRRQLTDPFGSDEEDEEILNNQNSNDIKTVNTKDSARLGTVTSSDDNNRQSLSPTDQMSKNKEVRIRVRQLLREVRISAANMDAVASNRNRPAAKNVIANGAMGVNTKARLTRSIEQILNRERDAKPLTEEARQAQLRERARMLIANAKAGIVGSPTSPSQKYGTVEVISKETVLNEIAAYAPDNNNREPSDDSPSHPEELYTLELDDSKESFEGDDANSSLSYIQSEMEALEREQQLIDKQAALLEKELRLVMESSQSTQEEDKLMSKWFTLVNKKNALLRRQMQLNILEQEDDLIRRCALLARELRQSMAVEEWRKSGAARRREKLLMRDLLKAVDERDRLVQQMDCQERAIEDDDEIERNLSQVEIQRKNNCSIQ